MIYLDHAATTPPDAAVIAAMQPFFESHWGNPASLHQAGRAARDAMEAARSLICQLLKAENGQLVFTSGATEANNLGIRGYLKGETPGHLITSGLEHSSVRNVFKALENDGWQVSWLTPDTDGFIHPQTVQDAMRADTQLVSVMHASNEVGTIQPIEALVATARAVNPAVVFHTDAVQTVGKLPVDISAMDVDLLTLSGHKVYGPRGIGALWVAERAGLEPVFYGGTHENNLRPGTPNVAGAVGMAKAIELACQRLQTDGPRLCTLREQLLEAMATELGNGQLVLNGPQNSNACLPGLVNLSIPGAEGETLVLKLDMRGICASSGSACHGAVIDPSPVLLAMGKPKAIAQGTLRLSMGRSTTAEDITAVCDVLKGLLSRQRKPTPASV